MSSFTFFSYISDPEFPEYDFDVKVEEPFFPLYRHVTVKRIKRWGVGGHHPFTITATVKFIVFTNAVDRINRMMRFMRNNVYGLKDCTEGAFRARLKLGMNHYDKNVKVFNRG